MLFALAVMGMDELLLEPGVEGVLPLDLFLELHETWRRRQNWCV